MGLQSRVESVMLPIKVSQQKQPNFFKERFSRPPEMPVGLKLWRLFLKQVWSYHVRNIAGFQQLRIDYSAHDGILDYYEAVLSGNGLGFGTVKIWDKCCIIQIFSWVGWKMDLTSMGFWSFLVPTVRQQPEVSGLPHGKTALLVVLSKEGLTTRHHLWWK